jgi:hypothetical protein
MWFQLLILLPFGRLHHALSAAFPPTPTLLHGSGNGVDGP